MLSQITCEQCALYVNGLRVADVYDPARLGRPVTQLTNCVVMGRGPTATATANTTSSAAAGGALHDLLLRFIVASAANATLMVGWLPCGPVNVTSPARPLEPLLLNNLFWKPSSGVAGADGAGHGQTK